MTQSIEEQIGAIAAVEPKFHLFQVGREMLGRDAMPRPGNSALEERESRFDCVGMNVAHDVDAGTVIDFLVGFGALRFPHGRLVCGSVVGENHVYVLGDVFADVPSERASLCVVSMEEPEITIALADADYDFFVVEFSHLALVAVPAANVGHIHFDFAIQHWLVGLSHCVPNAVAEIPRGFVGHPHGTLNLQSGHALFGFAEQVRNEEPFSERQVRVIKDRPRSNGELVIAVLAVEELLFGFEANDGHVAAKATRPFGPAEPYQQFPAFVFGSEQRIDIN